MATSLEKLVVSLEAESARYQRELAGARKQLSSFEKDASASATRLAKNVGAVLAAGFSVRQVAQWADSYTNLQNRLKLVTDGQAQLAKASREVFEIAQRSRADLGGTGELYFKIAQNAEKLGLSQGEVSRATETFAKALSLSGTSASGASGAILQFSQALASGAFRGDEFNSVAEAAPAFMDALARSIGVTRGELRALAADGKLSADILIKALLDQSTTIDREYSKTSSTIEQAFTRIDNAFVKLVGELESSTGVFSGIADGINLVADSLQNIADHRGAIELLLQVTAGAMAGGAVGGPMGAVGGAALGGFGGSLNIYNRKVRQERAARRPALTGGGEPGMSMLPADDGMSIAPSGFDKDVAVMALEAQAALDKLTTSTNANTVASGANSIATREVAEAYDFAAEKQEDAAQWAEELDGMYRQNEAAILGVDQATLQYGDTMEQLSVLLREGVISQDQYTRAAEKSAEQLDDYGNAVRKFGLTLRDDIKNSTSDLFKNLITDSQYWKDHLLAYLGEIGDAFAKMAADAAAQAIFQTSGSSGGGGINWLQLALGVVTSAAGGAAGGGGGGSITMSSGNVWGDGGVMPANQWSIVGDKGPELVMPHNAMRVFSNDDTMDMLGGRQQVVQNWTFNTPNADSFRASRRQIQRKEKAMLGI